MPGKKPIIHLRMSPILKLLENGQAVSGLGCPGSCSGFFEPGEVPVNTSGHLLMLSWLHCVSVTFCSAKIRFQSFLRLKLSICGMLLIAFSQPKWMQDSKQFLD